jgi:hypothetical protein
MSGEIKHEWNGSVLTVISDTGTSSADLKGPKGDTGPRGPQGPAGVIYNDEGELVVDLSPFALKAEVDALDAETAQEFERVDSALQTKASLEQVNQAIQGIDFSNYATKDEVEEAVQDIDLSNYATKDEVEEVVQGIDLTDYATHNYVSTEIAKAQLEGAGVDTSGFATKDDLAAVEADIDNKTIIKDDDGKLRTAIGGFYDPTAFKVVAYPNTVVRDEANQSWDFDCSFPLEPDEPYVFEATFGNGAIETINFVLKSYGSQGHSGANFENSANFGSILFYPNSENGYVKILALAAPAQVGEVLTQVRIYIPSGSVYSPIDARYIPVDGSTIKLNDKGQLVAGVSITPGDDVNLSNYYTKAEVDNKIKYGTTALIPGVSSLPTGTLYVVYE